MSTMPDYHTRLIWIDHRSYDVPVRVWAHINTLMDLLTTNACLAEKYRAELEALKAGPIA